ncbi:response regulator receiver domain containing protein [Acanthamoeba castellanii str. Neff]|uniref:Response regulator receiver domain containing protein n=1 Tax=Acanthamoeba castellanii (strain ATCC 30010 / Neff) TaxID=1257118 RepID=L8H9A5_ACACF|nr:response regulator receiver domain containing protein [Acanthamoeba castellanii str. Neff]ELR21822.1 response regulator receiver domain containing protein [Acanthamoeba castellanii str. Neff]
MSRLLQQRLGYQVFVASTVKDALDVAEREQGKFDLVISDIGLPDGTGLQLMKVLRENYRLKGIALSGYGMEEDVKRSKTAGFEVHLTKPVNFSSLTAAIHRLFFFILRLFAILSRISTPHGLSLFSRFFFIIGSFIFIFFCAVVGALFATGRSAIVASSHPPREATPRLTRVNFKLWLGQRVQNTT